MAEENFSDLGRIEAIKRLYEGTSYKPFAPQNFETKGQAYISNHSRVFLEGIDFDLVYFPLKHLGYKCVTAVTGELYADFSHPRTLSVVLGISAAPTKGAAAGPEQSNPFMPQRPNRQKSKGGPPPR